MIVNGDYCQESQQVERALTNEHFFINVRGIVLQMGAWVWKDPDPIHSRARIDFYLIPNDGDESDAPCFIGCTEDHNELSPFVEDCLLPDGSIKAEVLAQAYVNAQQFKAMAEDATVAEA